MIGLTFDSPLIFSGQIYYSLYVCHALMIEYAQWNGFVLYILEAFVISTALLVFIESSDKRRKADRANRLSN